MSGAELIRNMVDELVRTREVVEGQANTGDERASYLAGLVNCMDVDLARFYDYEDSIIAATEDIEIE